MPIRGHAYQLLLAVAGRGKQQSFFETLRQAEGASVSELEQLQDQLLSQLLQHAYSQVPYYKKVIDEFGGLEFLARANPKVALNRLPLLTKDIIREHWDDLNSRDLKRRKWYYNTSGGATGEPVRLIQDWDYFQQERAGTMLFDSWTGYSLGMPKAILWGSERDLLVGRETIKTRVGRWLRNECWLNAFRMTESGMLDYIQAINKVRPVQILAYPESIYQLSRFVEREGLDVYSPQAIMTSAETLYPHSRAVIERVFQAPVFNRYGSREVGDIACECKAHQGLHVSPLTHYVEIIREDGAPAAPGEVGEVVVTSLINHVMPLIRYRIGDMAVWAETDCACERKWPLLREVTGRVTDNFVSALGTIIGGGYFEGLLYFRDWVKRYQFIQESFTLVRLLIVPAVPLDQAEQILDQERADLDAKVHLVMGPECALEIELVSDIPPSSSGKYRYTISKVRIHHE